MSRQISIPDDIFVRAERHAAQQQLTVDDLISTALSEHIAGTEYIRRRGERANLAKFRETLALIPDVRPEPQDRLPEAE